MTDMIFVTYRMKLTKKIYCEGGTGTILDTVQLMGIYQDSKTFVDMKLINDPDTVLENWNKLNNTSKNPSREEVIAFISQNFSKDSELEEWVPEDWNDCPSFNLKTDESKQFCQDLNKLWKLLGRRISEEVLRNQDRYSLLYLPNPFVVPGGRFREVYYWDSFWIIRGLLLCGMATTARGMIDNLFYLVQQLDYVQRPLGNNYL